MMEQSVRLRNGHYEVALPWKVFPLDLPNNKMQAEQRLPLLKKRFTKDFELHQKYSQEVPDDQIGKPGWYLPHHSVILPQKASKVRAAFDCTAMFQGTSLNKQILQGPDLTNSLIGILSRFRKETIAVMADVEQMFY